MRPAPCKDCEKSGCGAYHDICPEYKCWRDEISAYREDCKKERFVSQALRDFAITRQKRMQRK